MILSEKNVSRFLVHRSFAFVCFFPPQVYTFTTLGYGMSLRARQHRIRVGCRIGALFLLPVRLWLRLQRGAREGGRKIRGWRDRKRQMVHGEAMRSGGKIDETKVERKTKKKER